LSNNKNIEVEKSKVSATFREQKHLRVLGSKSWTFPLQLAEIQMKTVVRSQMDVLMKMILKILARLEVKDANEISELLAVESIFVEHMLELMIQSKMVEKKNDTFLLTNSGMERLEQGTFQHDPMVEQVEITYSPYHDEALNREDEPSALVGDGSVPEFQFEEDIVMKEVTNLEASHIKQMIQDLGYEFLVEKGQKLIDAIDSVELKETLHPLCFEFHLYDRTEDTVFIRVWNTWIGKFDVKFEDALNQKEAGKLRQLYDEKQMLRS